MKKVLHYKTNYLNDSETFIDRLVKNHKKFSPVSLCYRPRSFTEGIPVFTPPDRGLTKWINFAAFHLNLPLPYYYKTIQQIRPDVIHAHFGFDAVKLMKISHLLDVPLVVSFYGSDVSRLPSEFGWKRRYRKLARHGTCFIAASQIMKDSLISLGFPEEKIHIVRFGVDMDVASFRGKYLHTPSIMMVGRMVEKKGFKYAIQALSELLTRGIHANLNLYGNGPLMESLRKLTVTLNLENQVQFHGYQPIENILDAHDNHSMLLAPSVTAQDGDMEGLPNTILEAMARGTPVVATRHAAIPEVIEHKKTGFLVEERDFITLADILEGIMKGEYDLETIRTNARQVVEAQYCVNRMVDEIEQIYDRVIRGMPHPIERQPYIDSLNSSSSNQQNSFAEERNSVSVNSR